MTETLDNNLDLSTFQFTEVGFGDTSIAVPSGSQSYQTTVALTYNGVTCDVQVIAGIHTNTGQIYAEFFSVDPTTGLPPDVLIGFLPPEDGTGRGEGYVSYTVQPKANLPTGTQITSVADISFDGAPYIATNQVDDDDPTKGVDPSKEALVTIDSGAPTSTVTVLPPTEPTTSFPVAWSGADDAGGSGVGSYTIYVSTNGGAFTPWLTNTASTSATFNGSNGSTYAFYSVATDNVGNVQPTPTAAQAATTVHATTTSQPLNLSGGSIYLKLDADGQHIDIINGSNVQSVLLGGISTVTVTGIAAGTSLTVDFTNGDPLPPAGLTFTGIFTGANKLSIIGTAGNDAVAVNGTNVTLSAAFGSAVIAYSNLSTISFAGGTGNDSLTQTAQPGSGASLTFVNPTSSDSLTVTGGTYTFPAAAAGSKIKAITLGSLSIGSGSTLVVAHSAAHASRAVLVLGRLSIAGATSAWTGTLDLADNAHAHSHADTGDN